MLSCRVTFDKATLSCAVTFHNRRARRNELNFGILSEAVSSADRPTNAPSQRCVIFSQNSLSFLLGACAARRLHWFICSWKKSALWSIAIAKRPRSEGPQERNARVLLFVPANLEGGRCHEAWCGSRPTWRSPPTYYVRKNEKLIMNNALAILIGAVIIAAAILIVFRWQLVPGVMLLDRWTGTVVPCVTQHSSTGKIYFQCD